MNITYKRTKHKFTDRKYRRKLIVIQSYATHYLRNRSHRKSESSMSKRKYHKTETNSRFLLESGLCTQIFIIINLDIHMSEKSKVTGRVQMHIRVRKISERTRSGSKIQLHFNSSETHPKSGVETPASLCPNEFSLLSLA